MAQRYRTNIYCPHCSRPVEIRVDGDPRRLLTAVHLQAERFGTEIHCHHCQTGFIYTRVPRRVSQNVPA